MPLRSGLICLHFALSEAVKGAKVLTFVAPTSSDEEAVIGWGNVGQADPLSLSHLSRGYSGGGVVGIAGYATEKLLMTLPPVIGARRFPCPPIHSLLGPRTGLRRRYERIRIA